VSCASCSIWRRVFKWFGVKPKPRGVIHGMIDVVVPSKVNPNNCTGIGDTLMALRVVHAVAEANPDKVVRMRPSPYSYEWAKIGWKVLAPAGEQFDHFTGVAETVLHTTPESYIEIDLEAQRQGVSCLDINAANCGVKPKNFTPLLDPEAFIWGQEQVAEHRTKAGQKTIILAPFAKWPHRNWPLMHWINLEEALLANGYNCLVLTGDGDGAELNWFESAGWFGLDAQKTAALVQAADLVISNDSGLAHLGGIMNKATLAICSPTLGRVRFGGYESVRVIQGIGPCTGCYFKEDRGYRDRACQAGCELFWDLKPSRVLNEVAWVLSPFKQEKVKLNGVA
jgi:Glycosyltransferase family 9 (heptosyltransferase)